MVWQPNILNNCYELSGGYAPEPPTRGSAPGPRWGTPVPQTPCAPSPPNPGYATVCSRRQTRCTVTTRHRQLLSIDQPINQSINQSIFVHAVIDEY